MSTEAMIGIALTAIALVAAFVGYVINLAVKVGGLVQRLGSLETRHNDNSREHREKTSSLEGRVNNSEKWQAGVDAKLDHANTSLAELKAMLSHRSP